MLRVCLSHIRICALPGAIFLYAGFGSPTPDDPGLLEVVLAALLISAVGAPGVSDFWVERTGFGRRYGRSEFCDAGTRCFAVPFYDVTGVFERAS